MNSDNRPDPKDGAWGSRWIWLAAVSVAFVGVAVGIANGLAPLFKNNGKATFMKSTAINEMQESNKISFVDSHRQMKEENELVLLAYYYPWYKEGDWTRHDYVGTPLLGEYGTDDREVAEQHIEWAAEALDVFVISWWGKDHMVERHLKKGLLQAKNLDKIRFCVLYESKGRLDELDNVKDAKIDFDEPDVLEAFVDDFQYLKQTYFNHSQYFKLDDGRPVVPIYLTRKFRNFKKKYIRHLEKELDMKLFLIADEPFFWAEDDPFTAHNGIDKTGEPVFEAYTSYNMFADRYVNKGETAWNYMNRVALPIFERWSKFTQYFPHVLPSYHDFRGHEPLRGGEDEFLEQLETMGCLPRPDNGVNKDMIFVTSFNEWWEGSTIEPAKEYGKTYLDVLRDYRNNRPDCDSRVESDSLATSTSCEPDVLMESGDTLMNGQFIISASGNAYIKQQGDCNLIVRKGHPPSSEKSVWSSGLVKKDEECYTRFQGDANLLTRRGKPTDRVQGKRLWKTGTKFDSKRDYVLALECDDNTLSIYEGRRGNLGTKLWSMS